MAGRIRIATGLLAPALWLAGFQAPEPAPKGSIEGRVVHAVTGEAVRRATLTLSVAEGNGKPATTQTDDNGRFAFGDLAAGGYRLAGERSGFQRQVYGARLNPESGAVIALSAGQKVGDLVFKLAPNAVISGRVLDQDGEPMPNLVVTAMKSGYVRGKRSWTMPAAAQTNDRGEYRIANLRAGRYLVSATQLNIGIGLAGFSNDTLDQPEPAYAATYHGNATDLARAVPVDVRMGEDRRGTDIQMMKVPTVRIRGKVAGDIDGKTLAVILLQKGSRAAGPMPTGVGVVQGNGTFEIRGIAPGSYFLVARNATDAMTRIAAPMPIDVAGRHIEGIELPLGGGGDLPGRVALSGNGAAGEITVTLNAVDLALPGSPSAKPADDGRFTLKNVFQGRYRVSVEGVPAGAYVASVRLGGQEVDDDGAELGPGSGELAIMVSRGAAQVEGTVTGPDGKPVPGAVVALVPESGRISRYGSATAGQDGHFVVKGICPGRYKALAWEDLEAGAQQDPEFVKRFEGAAESVSLAENGRAKLTLKAIPFEKVAEDR